MADLGRRRYADAIAHLEARMSRSPGDAIAKAHLGFAYAALGQRKEAQRVLSELQADAEQGRVSPYLVAIVYAGMDDRDRAFAWLDRSLDVRSRLLDGLNVNPVWAGMRAETRFDSLLRRIGLPAS